MVKMKKFKLSEDVLATVISYIQNRPLKEVEGLMNVLRKDIEFIGEEEVERPFPEGEVKKTFIEEEEKKEEEKPKKKSKKK